MFSHESTENLLDNLESELSEIIELTTSKPKTPLKIEIKNVSPIQKQKTPPPVPARRVNVDLSPIIPIATSSQPIPATRRITSLDKKDKNNENESIQLQSLNSDHDSITSESQQANSKHNTVIHVNEKSKGNQQISSNNNNIRVVHEADKLPDNINETFFVIKHGKWADQNDGKKEDNNVTDEEIKIEKEEVEELQNIPSEEKSNKSKKKKKVLRKKQESSSTATTPTHNTMEASSSSTESSSLEDSPPIKRKLKKNKAKKKDKKLRSDENSVSSYTEEESVSKKQNEKIEMTSVDKAIGIYINNTGVMKYRKSFKRPRMKVSFYNEDNGKQIGETKWTENGVFNDEFYNFICSWNEMITVNFDLKRLREIYNNIIIFFEMINCENVPICWAFFKLFTPTSFNIDKKFQLQFWEYQINSNSCFASLFSKKNINAEISIFEQWQMTKRKFPTVLNIFIKDLSLNGYKKDKTDVNKEEISSVMHTSSESMQRYWRKIPGQACRIPNRIFHKLPLQDKGSLVVKFSHDGNFLAFSEISKNGHLFHVYKFPEMTNVFTLLEHSDIIHDIDWLKQKNYTQQRIVTASADFTVIVWRFEEGMFTYSYTILPHPTFVYASKFLQRENSDNIHVVTGGRDNVVRIWKGRNQSFDLTQELKHPRMSQFTFITSIVTRNADSFYTSTSTGDIVEWILHTDGNYQMNRNFKSEEIHGKMINCMEINPRGNKICFRVQNLHNYEVANMIYVLGVPTGSITQKYQQTNLKRVNNQGVLKITPCGTQIFVSNGSLIRHYQLVNGNLVACEDGKNVLNAKLSLGDKGYISSIDYHPKDFFLACSSYGGNHGYILIYAYETNEIDPIEQMKMGSQEFVLQKSLEAKQIGAFSDIIKRLDEVFLTPTNNVEEIQSIKMSEMNEDNTFTIDSKRSRTYTVSKGPATFTIQKETYEIQRNDNTDDDTTISESLN